MFSDLALRLYGKDWKKVEKYIGTRSGAQIRSHAQKFFINIEKTKKLSIDDYIKHIKREKPSGDGYFSDAVSVSHHSTQPIEISATKKREAKHASKFQFENAKNEEEESAPKPN